MSKRKNEFVLNSNYYAYMEEEKEESKPIYKQLLFLLSLVILLSFLYVYFIKNNLPAVDSVWRSFKTMATIEKKESLLAVKEEVSIPISDKIEEREIIVDKPILIHKDELTDAYIQSIEEALGNY